MGEGGCGFLLTPKARAQNSLRQGRAEGPVGRGREGAAQGPWAREGGEGEMSALGSGGGEEGEERCQIRAQGEARGRAGRGREVSALGSGGGEGAEERFQMEPKGGQGGEERCQLWVLGEGTEGRRGDCSEYGGSPGLLLS